MTERSTFNRVNSRDLSVSKLPDAVLMERRDVKSTDMMCDVCGLLCRRRMRSIPEYLAQNVSRADEAQYRNGATILRILPTPDKGINPPVSECLNVAADNVLRICRLVRKQRCEELCHNVYPLAQALLLNADRHMEYCQDLGEFELALAHVVLFCPNIMNRIQIPQEDGGERQIPEEKLGLVIGELEAVLKKHRRIREGFTDLALPHRVQDMKCILSNLVENNSRFNHKAKVREICDSFLFSKVAPHIQKYTFYSNEVIAAGIYCLACTYAATPEANVDSISRELGVVPAAVHALRVRLGEDLSQAEKVSSDSCSSRGHM